MCERLNPMAPACNTVKAPMNVSLARAVLYRFIGLCFTYPERDLHRLLTAKSGPNTQMPAGRWASTPLKKRPQWRGGGHRTAPKRPSPRSRSSIHGFSSMPLPAFPYRLTAPYTWTGEIRLPCGGTVPPRPCVSTKQRGSFRPRITMTCPIILRRNVNRLVRDHGAGEDARPRLGLSKWPL
jgi:hypothetical protein